MGATDTAILEAGINSISELLETEVLGLEVGALGIVLLAVGVGFAVGRFVEVALNRLKTKAPADTVREAVLGALERPAGWMVRVGGIWLALNQMPLGAVEGFDIDRFANALLQATTVGLATWLGTRVIEGVCRIWAIKAELTEGTFDDQLVPIVRKTGKVFLWLVGVVMIIQNLGYSVSSLLAGLGIGGAAVAFASKDTVANFFGSIVIFIDRPFQVGDWIEVGDVEGTVEEVGIRVTRIRTFANSLITIPNAQFTTTSINNWSRMRKRRIKTMVGLTYDTTPEQMRAAVAAIREVILGDERLHHDFFLVNFHAFNNSSLDIFCYLFTRTTNWAEHMQVREDFLLGVMTKISELGLSFAFPTQTVHLEGLPQGFGEPSGASGGMVRDTPM